MKKTDPATNGDEDKWLEQNPARGRGPTPPSGSRSGCQCTRTATGSGGSSDTGCSCSSTGGARAGTSIRRCSKWSATTRQDGRASWSPPGGERRPTGIVISGRLRRWRSGSDESVTSPTQRFLTPEEVYAEIADYERRHPWLARTIHRWLGFPLDGTQAARKTLAMSVRMVAFRPRPR
jgi:hypothetical protein